MCVVLSHFRRVWLFVTPWTVIHQVSLSLEFSKQEYWNVLPCPSPGNLPNPEIESESPEAFALKADSLPLSHWVTRTPLERGKKKKDFVSIGRSRTLPPIQQGTASQSWTSWQQCLPRSKGMGWLYAWLPQSVDFCRGIWFSFTAPRALKQGFPDWGREELGKTKIRIPLKGFVFCCFHDSCRKPNHDSVRTSSKDAHVWSELNSTP